MNREPDTLSANKRFALRGVLIALAMILSWLESFIPVSSAVPGVKLGLANIVTLYALRRLGVKDALIISVLRVVLSAILFGNAAVMIYSLSGALISILIMTLLSRLPFMGIMGVSVGGAVSHNLAQCVVAMLLLQNDAVLHYLPVLLISGVIAGVITGAVSAVVFNKVG